MASPRRTMDFLVRGFTRGGNADTDQTLCGGKSLPTEML